MGAPYDIDDTIRLSAPYDIDATVRLGTPYDIGDIPLCASPFFSLNDLPHASVKIKTNIWREKKPTIFM
jgi:hypothetical protein